MVHIFWMIICSWPLLLFWNIKLHKERAKLDADLLQLTIENIERSFKDKKRNRDNL